MSDKKYRVAIIGCGYMGQIYADAYSAYPDTEIVAIAEHDPARLKAVGERHGVKALYADAQELFRDVVPDVAAVILPVKYIKDAVIAAAEAGVKGVSSDKPLESRLSDADKMVETCASRGVVFGGGYLQRAMNEVQEAAGWIREGRYGNLVGASVHGWGKQVSGGGCQHISVLRLFMNAEIEEVIAWGTPQEALESGSDAGLVLSSQFRLSNGMDCPGFGTKTSSARGGVDVWSEDSLIRWDWAPPEIYQGFDETGARVRVEVEYKPYRWSEFDYLTGSIRSFLAAIETGSELWVSGHDLRQALEVAIAARESAVRGNVPMKLPLEDRSLAIYPSGYRWFGGDIGTVDQTPEESASEPISAKTSPTLFSKTWTPR